jgi:hypothetical protein
MAENNGKNSGEQRVVETTPRAVGEAGSAAPNASAAPRATGTDVVTVGCKLPNGIVLRLHDVVEQTIVVNGQVIHEKLAQQRPGEFVLNGSAINMNAMAAGLVPDYPIVGGCGLTFGIPRDFWEEWEKQNPDLVNRRIVFAQGSEQRARDHAREITSVKSGFEPIDPDNPGARTKTNVQRGVRTNADIQSVG